MPGHEPTSGLDETLLREIVEGTAAATGEAFFDELVRHLTRALGTKCAWVTEWLPADKRLRALSFWIGDRYFGDFEYDIEGTPCEPVIEERRLVIVPERVIELYKTDALLTRLGAVSYLGLPLFDTDGAVLGHLAVLDDKPMQENPRALAILNIFAGRAAAELRRVRRDRDLREREEKLVRLVDSAMDAILELDGELFITRANSAAGKVFVEAAGALVGRPFAEFLSPTASGKLSYLTGDLKRRADGAPALWIPDGLEARRAGGETFSAEASLSRFEVAGQIYFTLILRDVEERLAAEERIRALLSETTQLRSEIDALQGFDDIVGASPALRRVLADIDKVAGFDATVLITGETGTGKELVAHAIHRKSARAQGPLVAVNCAAIAASLQESEFFGHERGAFTGATQRREGRFRLADKGTIFLDEIGEMSLDLQAKLLRVLQEGEFEPVGGSHTQRVDVRVIVATNRDLEAMVQDGTFRKDLLYRLNVFTLPVPPLRERGDDVVLLAEAFARDLGRKIGRRVAPLNPGDKERLRRYDWPGNVRELHNVIERALITSKDGHRLNFEQALPEPLTSGSPRAATPTGATNSAPPAVPASDVPRVRTAAEMQEAERRNIERALEQCGGRLGGEGGAARLLGMHPNTLASRLKALGLRRSPRPA